MRFEIVTIAELNEVIDILNRVTYDLLQRNIKQWDYPWNEKEVVDDILNKRLIAIKNEDTIMGVFSVKEITSFFDIASEDKVDLYIYRIAVDTNFQGKGVGALILDYCKEYGKEKEKEMYLDCWQGNLKLRSFYENQGLIHINDYKEDDYFVSVYKL